MTDGPVDLGAIARRVETAAPAPWLVGTRGLHNVVHVAVRGPDTYAVARVFRQRGEEQQQGSADFIAASRTDVPTLLRELQEARKALREIVEADTDLLGKIDAARATLARCTDEPTEGT